MLLSPTKVQFSMVVKFDDYQWKRVTKKSAVAVRRPLDYLVIPVHYFLIIIRSILNRGFAFKE